MTETAMQEDLRRFGGGLLEQCGGLVEWASPGQGTAVVPEEIARLLAMPGETFPLTSDPGDPGLCLSLATDFLDVTGAVLDAAVPRIGAFHVPERYLKKGDMQRAIDRCFTWLNARVRLHATRPTEIEYHTWWFFASLRSEDCWESQVRVTFNSASRAAVELPDLLDLADLEAGSEAHAPAGDTWDRAVLWAQERLKVLAADFLSRMDARLERDRKRLHDYYGALAREAGKPRRRAAEPPDPEQVAQKKRAVKLELQRKLSELEERYTLYADLKPLALIRTTLPTLAVDLSVLRKRTAGTRTVYWNSLAKQFEPLACSRCPRSTYAVAFTDDALAPLCAPCSRQRGKQASPLATDALAMPQEAGQSCRRT